jgi:hypothetical protein
MTSVPVQCDNCGHAWDHPLQCAIQVANGDTLTFAAGSIHSTCPQCGAEGVNFSATSATSTGKGIRGLLAVLQSISANTADLETLTKIAVAARRSGAGNAEVAQQIRASAPRLQALGNWMLSDEGQRYAPWLTFLITFLALVVMTVDGIAAAIDASTVPAPRSTIVVQCPVKPKKLRNCSNRSSGS